MPSERLGPIWDSRLSLWIAAMAANAAAGRPHASLAAPYVETGLLHTSAPAGESLLLLLIATDSPPRARAWVGAHDFDVPLVAAHGVPNLFIARAILSNPSAVVGWGTARGPRSIAVAALPSRTTTVVVVDIPNEPPTAQFFFVTDEKRAEHLSPDERPATSPVATVRTLVNALGDFARGKPLGAWGTPWIDPLWEILAAYTAIRAADQERARAHLSTLRVRFSTLPDVAVLAALLGETGPNTIDGVPLVVDGARAVAEWAAGADSSGSAGPRPVALTGAARDAPLFREAIAGTAFTTWASWPVRMDDGGQLDALAAGP
jgi:hypothetical protein